MIDISAFLNVLNNIWPYAVAVLVFLILIVIHEFGHFIAAKLLGVRVNEFAVGFGPKLFSYKGQETTYKLNLVPLGGYCAMEGEDESSSDERAFCNKKPWRRFLIVSMGAIFNIILGFILIGCMLIPTKVYTTTTVAGFYDGAVSSSYGLMEGDKILKVDGRRILTTYDLSYSFTNVQNGEIDITVLRDGEKKVLEKVKFSTEEEDGISYIVVDFTVEGEKRTFRSFISQTVKTTVSYFMVIWRSLIDLLCGKYGLSAVSGPVGVTAAIGGAAKMGLKNLLPIMSLITVNLGIFNLLPIPALDGGRLLFIIFEMIFRKPVPQKFEAIVHAVGFALLIAIMLLVTAKDIFGLIF